MSDKRKLTIKGLLASITATFVMLSYCTYYVYLETYGVKLNALFFVSTNIAVSVFSGLLFTFFKNRFVRVTTLFCSVFYFTLVLIYVYFYLLIGVHYAYIKTALIIGLTAGVIYYIYDTFGSTKHGRIDNN